MGIMVYVLTVYVYGNCGLVHLRFHCRQCSKTSDFEDGAAAANNALFCARYLLSEGIRICQYCFFQVNTFSLDS